ncbi:hypothetical protein [Pseudomonas chlororaphis]|uniref:hypothetical protein n=1 Tax=Pseudomonas chlororaphis TaxID=587753 RepID=UPI000AD36F65|nr:hypothetical protein [Pseudomonas chlororaphis]
MKRLHPSALPPTCWKKTDIHINGDRPWDIRFNAHGVIDEALARGNHGRGEMLTDKCAFEVGKALYDLGNDFFATL